MADIDYDPYQDSLADHAAERAGFVATAVNWAGGLLSVALIVGLTVWGYRLAVRDAGEVPVVRAIEGPMRVAPEDPGGMAAAHQGLAVNTVQAEGGVSAPPDRIVLAPPPVELTEDDLPRAALAPPARAGAEASRPDAAEAAAVEPVAPVSEADLIAAAIRMVEAESSGAAPGALARAPGEEAAAPGIVPAAMPGVARSPRPAPRPRSAVPAALPAALPVAPAVAVALDPAAIAPGTELAQLGAFDEADLAATEWNRLVTQHEDLLAGKARVIQQAESGGRSFYRLRVAGFEDLDDSRRFCAAMLARDTACIPVTAR